MPVLEDRLPVEILLTYDYKEPESTEPSSSLRASVEPTENLHHAL